MNKTVEVTQEELIENETPLSITDLTMLILLCQKRIRETKSEKTVRRFRSRIVKLNRLMLEQMAKN